MYLAWSWYWDKVHEVADYTEQIYLMELDSIYIFVLRVFYFESQNPTGSTTTSSKSYEMQKLLDSYFKRTEMMRREKTQSAS